MKNPFRWFHKSGPTGPVAFGYKMAWIAVRSNHHEEVVNFLELRNRSNLFWRDGIDAVYDPRKNGVFVTPSIQGWTFVVGWSAAGIYDAQPNKSFYNSLDVISSRFGEAQGFATQRVTEYHLWMLAKAGKVIRSFEYAGEQGQVWDDFGPLTEVEQALEFFKKPQDEWNPDENDVMRVAEGWSIDPTTLTEESGKAELGMFGLIGLKLG